MSKPLRAELCRVFADWQAGRMTCQAVQHWARETSTREADRYAAALVERLRDLGELLITCDDIPGFTAGFHLPAGEAAAALARSSGESVRRKRATDLRDDPFYGPQTRAILRDIS